MAAGRHELAGNPELLSISSRCDQPAALRWLGSRQLLLAFVTMDIHGS